MNLQSIFEFITRELKIHEIISLYSQEIAEHMITFAELREIVELFTITELSSPDVNELILIIITYYHS